MFSNSICGGRRVWLILLCLANLDVSSGDDGLELMQANFKLLQEQIVQLSDFVRNNSESMNSKLETKVAQLTELINTNSNETKQQVEMKIAQLTKQINTNSNETKQQTEIETSLLTNVVEKNYALALNQISQHQQKTAQLTERMKTNFEATKTQIDSRFMSLINTITSLEKTTRDVQNITSEVFQFVTLCQMQNETLVCPTHSFGSGWIVIQQRVDYSLSFDRTWAEYRDGFGVISSSSSFWWGLEKVHQLTKEGNYELLLEMKKGGDYRFARYSEFYIEGESDKYRLTKLGGYSGTAGDFNANEDSDLIPTGQRFTTKDSANDQSPGNCASEGEGGWWWNDCGYGLNDKRAYCYEWGYLTYTRMLIRAKS